LQFSGVLVLSAAVVTFRHGVLTRATGRAIENYHQERGSYLTQLGALTPDYLPIIFGPLTRRGQVWCYQASLQTVPGCAIKSSSC